MSDRSKKITELTALASLEGADLLIVEDVSANATKKATLTTIRSSIIRGPFTDQAAAVANGVSTGQPYYINTGEVKVVV